MKRGYIICLTYLIIVILIPFSNLPLLTTATEDPLQIDEYLSFTVGDYFEYDLNIDDMLAMMVEYDDAATGYKDVYTKMKISVTGTEKLIALGRSNDCWILQWDMEMKYTIVGDGVDLDEYISEMTVSAIEWMCQDRYVVLKSEANIYMREEEYYPPGSYFFESFRYEAEICDKNSYTKVEDKPPFPLKIGKTWSYQNAYTQNSTIKSRYQFDNEPYTPWITEYEETDYSETIMYEVVSENENVVTAGTFKTLKIKNQIKGDSDYSYVFYDKYGMNIEEHYYDEDSALSEMISLKDFQYDQAKDTDSDGHIDIYDDFPKDPDEYIDSDNDGVGDNSDAFPDDPSETKDTDNDGVGDNADNFPYDPTETLDSDGDGAGDNSDAFPNDPTEFSDSDSDGVGDYADVFPFNANETRDSDSDGVGDNSDAFPLNEFESRDTDSDGVGDKTDAFPEDPAASLDSDYDGYPDLWNYGKSRDNSTTGLVIDAHPFDSTRWEKEPENSIVIYLIIIAIIILVVVVIVALLLIQKKRRTEEKKESTQPFLTLQHQNQPVQLPQAPQIYQYQQQQYLQPQLPQYPQQPHNYYQPPGQQQYRQYPPQY